MSVYLEEQPQTKAQRIFSIDFLRGILISAVAALFAAPLEHFSSGYGDVSVNDYIIPLLLFLSGASASIKLTNYERKKGVLYASIRAVCLFAIGSVLTIFVGGGLKVLYPLSITTYPLQTIAIAVWITSLLVLLLGENKLLGCAAILLLAHFWGDEDFFPVISSQSYWGIINYVAIAMIGALASRLIMNGTEGLLKMMIMGVIMFFLAMTFGAKTAFNPLIFNTPFALNVAGVGLCMFAIVQWTFRGKGKLFSFPFAMIGANPLVAYVVNMVIIGTLRIIPVTLASGVTISLEEAIYTSVGSFIPPFFIMVIVVGITLLLSYKKIINFQKKDYEYA